MPAGVNNNLIPYGERDNEEHRRNAQAGGRASGEARREKKRLKDCANLLLSLPVNDINKFNAMSQMGIPIEDIDNRMLMVTGLLNQACKGDTSAAKEIRSLIGEDGSQQEDSGYQYPGLPARVLGKAYVDINRDIDAERHTFYDFKGGRGSLKSSYCGLKLIDLIMSNDSICGLAIKQLKNDLKDSVYSQIVWSIDELGLTDDFHCTKNPMEIKRKSTGQIIYFRGGEDPAKIKSIKPPHDMHIGVVWIEEADQIKGEDAYRNIQQSAARGGERTVFFRSYNTPRSRDHYINKEELKPNPLRIVHHSHFVDAPVEWLGQTFFDIAEQLKEANPTAYAHEYDGEAVGNGANVFENVTVREITDEEIAAFDRCYYGLDWGWYPDPNHFSECYFNAAQRRLYIYGELRRNKTSNEDMATQLNDWKECRITADSAEPKSIADFKSYGFDIRKAVKPPGSVDYSMKWLASLTEIIIDSARCPFSAEEFSSYEFERDKDSNVISGYPDKDNHAIDSVRYATEEIWIRRGQ